MTRLSEWRGEDLNLRPSGYEPDELPDCSTRGGEDILHGPLGLHHGAASSTTSSVGAGSQAKGRPTGSVRWEGAAEGMPGRPPSVAAAGRERLTRRRSALPSVLPRPTRAPA